MKYPGDFSSWTTQMVHNAFGFQDTETLPDLMVAKGEFEPTLPYFCMQEYKPKQKTSDPRGLVTESK